MVQKQDGCPICETANKAKKRDFSDQAWSVLLLWGEVDQSKVDLPMCEDCYEELREVLIDRADEMDDSANRPAASAGRRAS